MIKKEYKVEEAIKLMKSNSKENFDATAEVHINFTEETKKVAQGFRFTTVLPKGSGKNKKVAVLTTQDIKGADLVLKEDDIEKLVKGTIKPKTDFDVLITEPRYMPMLAKAAKILGPAGVMPNPKTGTVTQNVQEAINQTKAGKIEVKMEKDMALTHSIFGKISFKEEDLVQNFESLMTSIRQNRPNKAKMDWIKSIYIAPTMGDSHKISL